MVLNQIVQKKIKYLKNENLILTYEKSSASNLDDRISIDAKNFDEVIEFGKSLNKLFIVTRSDKGSIAIEGNDVSEAQAKSNLNIVDLTGAGDLFAAGFLHGYVNNLSTRECLEKGTEMSSKVIQQIGARL